MITRSRVPMLGCATCAVISVFIVVGFSYTIILGAHEFASALDEDEKHLWIAYHPTLAEAQDGLRTYPKSPLAHARMGYAHYDAHDYEQAIKQFQLALGMQSSLSPDNESCHLYLGRCYVKLNRYDKAKIELLKVLHDQPFREYGYLKGPSTEAMNMLLAMARSKPNTTQHDRE